MKAGDKVLYGKTHGEVVSIADDTAVVKLEDGKEYAVHTDVLTMAEEKPKAVCVAHMRKPENLAQLAKELQLAGVTKLTIENGEVTNFDMKESLQERKDKYRAEIDAKYKTEIDAAEKKAEEEFVGETKES